MSRHQFREWVDILETLWGALGEGPLKGAWVDCDAIALEGGDQDGPDMDEGKDTDEAACVKVESMVCFDAVAHVNILGDERRFFEAVESRVRSRHIQQVERERGESARGTCTDVVELD